MTQKDSHASDGTAALAGRPRRLRRLTEVILFWPAAIGGAALDLWSKKAVFDWLFTTSRQEFILIDGFVRFILCEKEGAAFSIFEG
jgi:lipoprotein signal peptidase